MSILKICVSVSLSAAVATTSLAGDFEPASVSSDFGRLVPDGAWAVVYTPSMNHLVQELMPIARSIDPQAAQGLMMMPMMMQMIATSGQAKDGRPAPPAQFHLDKPMGLALGPNNPETGEPSITVILSAKDADKIHVSGMSGGPSKVVPLTGTDYLAITTKSFTPGTNANALCDGMFAADIAINLDQAAVVKAYGPMINEAMKSMDMMIPLPSKPTAEQKAQAKAQQRMMEYNVQQMRVFLDGFDVWNFGIDFEATDLDVLAQYTLAKGSAIPQLAGSNMESLAALCTRVASDMPMQFVVNAECMQAMTDMSMSMDADAFPKATQAKMAKLVPLFDEVMQNIQTGVAGGMSFGDSGIQVVEVMDVKDSAAMMRLTKKAWAAMSNADIGVSATNIPSTDGVGFDIVVDEDQLSKSFGMNALMGQPGTGMDPSTQMKKMMQEIFGGGSIQVHMMAKGDLVGMAVGNDKALAGEVRKLMVEGTKSSPLGEALSHSWAKPTWAAIMNVRSLASQGLGMAKAMAGPARVMLPKTLPAGEPVMFEMVGSATADAEQVRVRTDIAAWIKFVKQIQAMDVPKGRKAA